VRCVCRGRRALNGGGSAVSDREWTLEVPGDGRISDVEGEAGG